MDICGIWDRYKCPVKRGVLIERCPQFRGVLIETHHCIPNVQAGTMIIFLPYS